MKRSLSSLFLFVCPLVLTSVSVIAQTPNTSRPTSEQSLQELVAEVRQLRAELSRINAAVYKGQVMIERLKLIQQNVARLSSELNGVREQLSDLRLQQTRLKELLGQADKEVEVGVKSPGDQVTLKAEIESILQREQRLAMRDTQLANELELERARLNELNEKLNLLDSQLAPK